MHPSTAPAISSSQPPLATDASSSLQLHKVREPAASKTPPRKPVFAPLCERPARWDAEFAVLDEAFLGREDRVLELESSWAKSFSSGTNLRSQVSTLWTGLNTMRPELMAF